MLRKSESGPMAGPRRMAFSATGKPLYQRASERRVSAGTRYLMAVCCVSFATNGRTFDTVRRCDQSGGHGNRLEIDTPLGVKVPIRYSENGRITGEARSLANFWAPSDSGKWWCRNRSPQVTKWFDGVCSACASARMASVSTGVATVVKQVRRLFPRHQRHPVSSPRRQRVWSRRNTTSPETNGPASSLHRQPVRHERACRNGASRQPSHDGIHECRSPIESAPADGMKVEKPRYQVVQRIQTRNRWSEANPVT